MEVGIAVPAIISTTICRAPALGLEAPAVQSDALRAMEDDLAPLAASFGAMTEECVQAIQRKTRMVEHRRQNMSRAALVGLSNKTLSR